MAENDTPPPRIGGNVAKWAKKNKLAVAGIVGGAGFLFLSRKGAGGSGDVDARGLVVPVAGTIGEGTGGAGLPTDDFPYVEEPPIPQEPAPPAEPPPAPEPADPAPSPDPDTQGAGAPPAAPAPAPMTQPGASGVTIAGRNFPGATGRQQVGAGTNSNGHYVTWLVIYPNRTERWNHYSGSNRWVGPFGGNVTSPGGSGGGNAPAPPSTPQPPRLSETQPVPQPMTPAPQPTGNAMHPHVALILAGGVPGWRPGGVGGFLPGGAVASEPNIGSGNNSNGHYVTHRFIWPGGTHYRYNHYTSGSSAGRWVGPF